MSRRFFYIVVSAAPLCAALALVAGREFPAIHAASPEPIAARSLATESAVVGVAAPELARLTSLAAAAAPAARDPHADPGYMGISSCAAAACHGGAASPAARADWKNAYSKWIQEKDPHRYAYTVLKSDRSKRILWLLDGAPADRKPADVEPYRDARCLTCHSSMPDAETPLADYILADGVSCEACHGPSEKWRGSHTLVSWKNDKQRYRTLSVDPAKTVGDSLKMWNTKEMSSRAAICARCHVGGPDRDVNHDLIAAGHPRLNFEFASFMAQMPKHWDDTLDRQAMIDLPSGAKVPPRTPDHEVRVWSVGQATDAVAALRLLRQRIDLMASQGNDPTMREDLSTKTMLGRAVASWPELSEYDCYACHHDLNAQSWRRLDVQGVPPNHPRKRPGTLPWANWNFTQMQVALLWQGPDSAASRDIEEVRQAMQKVYVPPQTVHADVRKALTTLEAQLDQIGAQTFTAAQVREGLRGLTDLPQIASWDEAVQRYLAYVALTNGLADLDPKWAPQLRGEKGSIPPLKAKLQEIRKALGFEQGVNSPNLPTAADWNRLIEHFDELPKLIGQ